MSISRAGDFFYALRIVKLLVTPWEKQAAYKHGIIDGNGKLLRKFEDLRTTDEKDSFSYLHRMVFNLKRLLGGMPGGRSFIGAATASYLLLRENFKEFEIGEREWEMIHDELFRLCDDAPTNVTGAAVSTDTPKPIAMFRRKPKKKDKELTDDQK